MVKRIRFTLYKVLREPDSGDLRVKITNRIHTYLPYSEIVEKNGRKGSNG